MPEMPTAKIRLAHLEMSALAHLEMPMALSLLAPLPDLSGVYRMGTVQRWCELLDGNKLDEKKSAIFKRCWRLAESVARV